MRYGWQVTATDISCVALERARVHAASAVTDITFVQADLVDEPLPTASFDLVNAQFFQITDPPRTRFMRSLGDAVQPAATFSSSAITRAGTWHHQCNTAARIGSTHQPRSPHSSSPDELPNWHETC